MTALAGAVGQRRDGVGVLPCELVEKRKNLAGHLAAQLVDLGVQVIKVEGLGLRPRQLETPLDEHETFELKQSFEGLVHGWRENGFVWTASAVIVCFL